MKIFLRSLRSAVALTFAAFAAMAPAQAQQYPSKPVTIIADSAAGSTPDVVLRIIADRLGQLWRQQVIAVNHPGAGGSLAVRVAADAAPDGYVLYMPVLSTFVALPNAAANLPIQLPRDFLPIGFAAENPMFVAVTPSLGSFQLARVRCSGESAPGRDFLCGDRHRPAHPSHG